MAILLFALAILLLLGGCGAQATHTAPRHAERRVEVRYEISGRATVAVYTADGRLVRRLIEDEPCSAGVHALAWDGRDDDGAPVHDRVLLLRVVVENAQARSLRMSRIATLDV